MVDNFFNDVIEMLSGALDRFFLAFTRIYEGMFDEYVRETITGYDITIVAVTVGFILFFLRAEIASVFGSVGKSGQKRRRRERMLHYTEKGDDDDDEEDFTVGRR